MGEFTHFNQHGAAIMVDISKKAETAREAIAEGRISMNQECFDQLKAGSIGKGDVLGVARIAGIMGGDDSKILDTTDSIIIECAIFDHVSIRNTARR